MRRTMRSVWWCPNGRFLVDAVGDLRRLSDNGGHHKKETIDGACLQAPPGRPIYGSEEAGRRLAVMLEKGRSQPWQDTLEELTGGRETDASAIIDYFAPLMAWLAERNQGQTCGW